MTCETCPLGGKQRRVLVRGQFPEPAVWNGLAVVGEQPAYNEAREGLPFVGASGQLIQGIAARYGIDWTKTIILNAISCYEPSMDKLGKSQREKVVVEASAACHEFLERTLAEWKPRVVLALGGVALRALLGDPEAGLHEYRGTVLSCGSLDAAWMSPLVVSWHPSAILRGTGHEAVVLDADVAKVARWLREGGPALWPVEYVAAPSPQVFHELVETIRFEGWCAVDTETLPDPWLNRYTAALRTVQLGTPDFAMVLPWSEWRQHYTEGEWAMIETDLRELLLDWRVSKVAQNGQYDWVVLKRHGLEVRGYLDDTMVAHHTLHLRGVSHELQYATAQYFDCPPWKTVFKESWNAPFEKLALYAAQDALWTARLWRELQARILARGAWDTYALDRESALMAWTTSWNGMPVDWLERLSAWGKYSADEVELMAQALDALPELEEVQAMLLERLAPFLEWRKRKVDDLRQGEPWPRNIAQACFDTAEWVFEKEDAKRLNDSAMKLSDLPVTVDMEGPDMRKETGARLAQVRAAVSRLIAAAGRVPFLNLDSGQQVGRLLHEDRWLGLETAEPPGADGYLTNEVAIYHLKAHPFVKAWQSWKSAGHRRKWYETLPVWPDGRIHVNYKTHVTPTARWASGSERASSDLVDKFNGQNLEKPCRSCIRVRPGNRLIAFDLKGVELRTAAAISGDRFLLNQIATADAGLAPDVHTQNAMSFWPKEWEELDAEGREKLRTPAKRGGFGKFYGMTPGALLLVVKDMKAPARSLTEQQERDKHDLAFCEDVMGKLERQWWELFAWMDKCYWTVINEGWEKIGYVTGRTIWWPLHDRDHVNRNDTRNYPVQGCKPAFTKVFTRNGLLPIGEIPETGEVWTGTHWASYTRVCRGDWELARVRLANGQEHVCDTRDELLVEGATSYEFRKFNDLRPGDRVCFSAPQAVEAGGSGPPVGLAYWMGFFIGNGSTGGERWSHCNALHVTIGVRKERYTIDAKFAELNEFVVGLGFHLQKPKRDPGPQGGRLMTTVESVAFRALLESHGYPWGADSHAKRVPMSVWSARLESRKAFLLGLLDADGYVGHGAKRGGANLHMSNRELLAEVQQLFRTIGVRSTLRGPYNYASASWTLWRLDLCAAQLAEHLGYGVAERRAKAHAKVPRFVAERFVRRLQEKGWPRKWLCLSDGVLCRRMQGGGSVGVDVLLDLVEKYLGEPFELYDAEPVIETKALGVVAPTYTLCVDDPGHRFDSEGVISKNTAREVMLTLESRIFRRLPRAAKPIFDEHDALGIECPEALVPDVLACIREEGRYDLEGPAGSIPILMDIKIGKSWLQVK